MDEIDEIIQIYKKSYFEYEQFLAGVRVFFEKHPLLNNGKLPIIHSIKYRLKDPDHLKDKLRRKKDEGKEINKDNFFDEITDLAGIRVLHIYQDQFKEIHQAIQKKIESGDWVLKEAPKAYTWDPESKQFYEDLGLNIELKDTYLHKHTLCY